MVVTVALQIQYYTQQSICQIIIFRNLSYYSSSSNGTYPYSSTSILINSLLLVCCANIYSASSHRFPTINSFILDQLQILVYSYMIIINYQALTIHNHNVAQKSIYICKLCIDSRTLAFNSQQFIRWAMYDSLCLSQVQHLQFSSNGYRVFLRTGVNSLQVPSFDLIRALWLSASRKGQLTSNIVMPNLSACWISSILPSPASPSINFFPSTASNRACTVLYISSRSSKVSLSQRSHITKPSSQCSSICSILLDSRLKFLAPCIAPSNLVPQCVYLASWLFQRQVVVLLMALLWLLFESLEWPFWEAGYSVRVTRQSGLSRVAIQSYSTAVNSVYPLLHLILTIWFFSQPVMPSFLQKSQGVKQVLTSSLNPINFLNDKPSGKALIVSLDSQKSPTDSCTPVMSGKFDGVRLKTVPCLVPQTKITLLLVYVSIVYKLIQLTLQQNQSSSYWQGQGTCSQLYCLRRIWSYWNRLKYRLPKMMRNEKSRPVMKNSWKGEAQRELEKCCCQNKLRQYSLRICLIYSLFIENGSLLKSCSYSLFIRLNISWQYAFLSALEQSFDLFWLRYCVCSLC